MGKIIIIDFKKRNEKKELKKLCHNIVQDFSAWVRFYLVEDDTPPNEEECAALENDKIEELKAAFDEKTKKLWRIPDLVEKKTAEVHDALDIRRGYLYRRFADDVEELKDQAADMLGHCVKSLGIKEGEVDDLIPMKESEIMDEFNELQEALNEWIETNFPDGVDGLDSYDDELPDGIPSFAEFLETLAAKKEEMIAKNADAIAAEVEEIKEANNSVIKEKVNEAINKAIEAIAEDLSDDVLDYLDEDAMAELREELIQGARDYGASRLDE
eukprot:CAMPEP_0185727418 /NCGR_PEP_ID=MMETSP1171-20130828/3119_1 /TAXON_ID=374046 /ORGANISM="Helicotheca tamensis, Strain CCMP826" /LENGTH=270 /DNA_ID=CAMNT_0028395987 /DNA_START=25 /DNA_END=837 /DNA_ORIENTATION=-